MLSRLFLICCVLATLAGTHFMLSKLFVMLYSVLWLHCIFCYFCYFLLHALLLISKQNLSVVMSIKTCSTQNTRVNKNSLKIRFSA